MMTNLDIHRSGVAKVTCKIGGCVNTPLRKHKLSGFKIFNSADCDKQVLLLLDKLSHLSPFRF